MRPILLSVYLLTAPTTGPLMVEADLKGLADNSVCLPADAEPLLGQQLRAGTCTLEVKRESNCPGGFTLLGQLCGMSPAPDNKVELTSTADGAEGAIRLVVHLKEPKEEAASWAAAAAPALTASPGTSFYRRDRGQWDRVAASTIEQKQVEGAEIYMIKADGSPARLKQPTTTKAPPGAETAPAPDALTTRRDEIHKNLRTLQEAEQTAYLDRDAEHCKLDGKTRPRKTRRQRKKCEELAARVDALALATNKTTSAAPVTPTTSDASLRACLMQVSIPHPLVWPTARTSRYATRVNRRLREETLCLYTTNGTDFSVMHAPTYPLPGKPLRVILLATGEAHLEGLKVSQVGTLGLSEPTLDTKEPDAAPVPLTAPEEPKPLQYRVIRFAGRAPGDASVIIKDQDDKELHRSEILLPRTYLGSVRVGLGLVFGRAVERQYEAIKVPGSATYQVTQKDCGLAGCDRVAVEFVLAYSVYLEAMIGGRDYQRHVFSRQNWGIGPILGAGIVGQSSDKVDFFKSFYMGLEFEPVRFFSVAAGAVLRRVNTLGDGYRIGSALADKEIPYQQGHAWGAFLMFNFAPAFLKTAQPKGG